MDDDSRLGGIIKWGMGAAGLGMAASVVFLPFRYGIILAAAILLLFLLLFGGYFLWRRRRARREREQFSSAIETQTAATPKSISDPSKRADLDRVRQKFQGGLQEFKSRGKDIYKLPWYVIIGESGSGKTEVIRHSGVDFPPGLQDELQGSGGTVNMDWWFTNRGIILDTAGSMLFNEARAGESPEWREFLRLLKRARPQCPVNGLFLVLSVESLIRDSSDTIAQKASRFAQQLDLIQRTLDVRFPVYLLVTKCDLLTGFREFFDSIDDPLLQHQMFGWSNPDPLDTHFRPDLVEQYLSSVTARLRRRRMALIRDTSGTGRLGDTQQFFASTYQLGRGPAPPRRLDEVDSLFALPESVMRLAPRLRRYLETIFVAGEWSAKPVFLRGIYFTSSMREGKALDEAIALATGLPLDQLPEDRAWGEKNRAFFLRDLFLEKVFRESGLVTRATNTLKLLRQRQFAIFGTAGVALLLLLVFAGFAYHDLKQSVGREALYWQVGATNSSQGEWSSPIVRVGSSPSSPYLYAGDQPMPGLGKITLVEYQKQLRRTAEKELSVGWIFAPIKWMRRGKDEGRPVAQRLLFEGGVLKPLVARTRDKMQRQDPAPSDPAALGRQRDALIALVQLEADGIMERKEIAWGAGPAEKFLRSFLSYLTETNCAPDTNLVEILSWCYDPSRGKAAGLWPPASLRGGATLAANPGIAAGLEKFQKGSAYARSNIDQQLTLLNDLTDSLNEYHQREQAWLASLPSSCDDLLAAKAKCDAARAKYEAADKRASETLTNLSARYLGLQAAASDASASVLRAPILAIEHKLPQAKQATGLLPDIIARLDQLASQAADSARSGYEARRQQIGALDSSCMAQPSGGGKSLYELRWNLYSDACALASGKVTPNERDIGDGWKRFGDLKRTAEQYRTSLGAYKGPFAPEVSNACSRIASGAIQGLKTGYVTDYANLVSDKLRQASLSTWTAASVTNVGDLLTRIQTDLDVAKANDIPDDTRARITRTTEDLRQKILDSIDKYLAANIGFPVTRSSHSNTLQELVGIRSLLLAVSQELQGRPVWHCDTCNLRTDCDRYSSVVNAFVNEDGTGADWDFYFVPPPDQGDDRVLVTIFRYTQAVLGGKASGWQELTTPDSPVLLGRGTADSSLAISFRKHPGGDGTLEKPWVDRGQWGLPGLFLFDSRQPERFDDGLRWRFRISPVGETNSSGAIIFEARLIKKRPLPKWEDWPKPK